MVYEKIQLKDAFPLLGEAGADPTLEVYLPENMAEIGWEDKKHPCVLVIPGGGYRFVSRREAEPIALQLLPRGYNVFVLTYSVQPHAYPTQIREVAAALELIWKNAEAWHCDTEKVAMMGFSAGGHLAAHYSNRYDCPEVRQLFADSKAPNAVVLGYPVITADPRYSHKGSFEKLNGGAYPEDDRLDFFSCDRMVSDRTPPTFLWHCSGDKIVPVKNSLLYADALAEHGIPFQLHIYPGGKHGLGTADRLTNVEIKPEWEPFKQWLPAMLQWLQTTLELEF